MKPGRARPGRHRGGAGAELLALVLAGHVLAVVALAGPEPVDCVTVTKAGPGLSWRRWCPALDLKNRAKNETLFFLTVFMTVFIFIY